MKQNPVSSLLHSRKFLILLLDTFLALVTLLVTNHLEPDLVAEILAVITIVQPLWIAVIVGITKEDVSKTDSYQWAEQLAKAIREDDAINDESPVG
jgi:hypothetical protein